MAAAAWTDDRGGPALRRHAPRPLGRALEGFAGTLAPPTLLARVQACWAEVAGETVAAESEPVGERAGTVTVRCGSSVWAGELQLLSEDLLARLNAALSGVERPDSRAAGGAERPDSPPSRPAGSAPVRGLRFVAGGGRGTP